MPPGKEPRVSIIIAAKNLAGRVFDEVRAGARKVAGDIKGAFSGVKGVLGTLTAAVGGFSLARFFSGAIQEAREAERASIDLRGSVQNLGLSYDALKPKLDAAIDRLADLAGKDDEEVSDALSNLITKTQDVGGSLEHMTLVLGIAKKEKLSLASASDKVAKVMNGQTKAARELGVTTKDTGKALAELHKRYDSFATDDSTTGILERIRNAWNNVKEAVGTAIFDNDRVRESLRGVVTQLQNAERWVKAHGEELGRLGAALADVLVVGLRFAGWLVRVTSSIVTFLTRHREATMFVGASVGTFWLLNSALLALGATTVPRLLVVLRQFARLLTGSFALSALNPVVLGIAAVSAAIGGIIILARSGQRELNALRDSFLGMSDVQLGMEWNKQATELRKARQQLEEARAKKDEPKQFGGGDPTMASATMRQSTRAQDIRDAEKQVQLQEKKLQLIDAEFQKRGQMRAQLEGLVNIPRPRTGGGDEDEKTLEQRIRLAGDALEIDVTRAAALRELIRIQAELTAKLNSGLLADTERFELAKALHAIEEIRAKDLERQRKLEDEHLDRLLAMTTPELLKNRRTKEQAEALLALYDAQRDVNAALKAENDAIAKGLGNLERKAQLEEQLAKIAERLGNAPRPSTMAGSGAASAPRTLPRPGDVDPRLAPAPATPDTSVGDAFKQSLRDQIGLTEEAIDRTEKLAEAWAHAGGAGVGAFVTTALAGFEQVGAGQQKLGRAFGQAIRAGVIEAARHFAGLYLAKALAAKGLGLLGHIGAFAAAAAFATAAGMFSRIGGGATSSGGGDGGSASSFERIPGRQDAANGGPLFIELPAGPFVFNPNDPATVREWKNMWEQLTGRRVILVPNR